MARLILHLGRSKTGSTLIQEFLSLNRSRLAADGVVVPDVFATSNHAELAVAFSASPGALARAQAITSDDDRRRLRRRLASKLRAAVARDSTWVMTSEHLSSRVREGEGMRQLRAFLEEFFDEIHAVAYLRRPDHLAPSLYSEAVKAGRTQPLDSSFVTRRARSFDHDAFIERWSAALAPHPLIPRPYVESYKASPTALVADLLSVVSGVMGGAGVALDAESWALPDRPLNQSLSAEATEFVRLVNPYVPDGPLSRSQRRTLIREVRTGCPGAAVALTASAAEALAAAGLLEGSLDRAWRVGDDRWREWFDAGPATVEALAVIAPDRLVALMAGLSAPEGPIRWGGRQVPAWVPDGALEAIRTAAVRMLRR